MASSSGLFQTCPSDMADVFDMYEETWPTTLHTLQIQRHTRVYVMTNTAVLHRVLDATVTVHPVLGECREA